MSYLPIDTIILDYLINKNLPQEIKEVREKMEKVKKQNRRIKRINEMIKDVKDNVMKNKNSRIKKLIDMKCIKFYDERTDKFIFKNLIKSLKKYKIKFT